MKVVWTETALAHLAAIRRYIAQNSELYAERTVQRVLSAYLEGRISVVEAVTYFVGLTDESNWPGIGVDLQSVDDETRIRAEELFRRIAWCKFTGADPAAEPEYSFDDMLRALGRAGHIDPESSV